MVIPISKKKMAEAQRSTVAHGPWKIPSRSGPAPGPSLCLEGFPGSAWSYLHARETLSGWLSQLPAAWPAGALPSGIGGCDAEPATVEPLRASTSDLTDGAQQRGLHPSTNAVHGALLVKCILKTPVIFYLRFEIDFLFG